MSNKKYWKEFNNKYNVPRIMDSWGRWDEYWENIKRDELGYVNLTPYNDYFSEWFATITYIVVCNVAFLLTTIFVGFWFGILAYFIAMFLVFVSFVIFQKVAFITIPYKKYCKAVNNLKKEQEEIAKAEAAAVNSGDLVAKYNALKKKVTTLSLTSRTTQKNLDNVFNLAEKLVNLSVTNPAFSTDVSRYINIYLTEIVNSLEKNQQNLDSPEIYKKYLREINDVLKKLEMVFVEALEDVVEINAMPIDASLKAVSNMLDGEQMGGNLR